MSVAWLWILPALPAIAGGGLLLAARRARSAAGPVALTVGIAVLGTAIWAWAAQPEAALVWLPAGPRNIGLHLSAAETGGVLASMVAGVSLLVLVYSHGYMEEPRERPRFFGFMLLFLGALELFVLAQDLLTVLIAFELMGLCSYALIGFWHEEGTRVRAANRAFLTTRSTDLGLYVAAFAAFAATGGFKLDGLARAPSPWLDVIAFGLIVAAAGKSAQLPFSGWLSGAMLGPSPVSALLHSATMVAAGAILLVKAVPALTATGWALPLVLWLGVATALLASLVALYQDDLKQLLAASTVSQFGYVFAGIGASGAAAALGHLVAHAAFKALLFMVAGVLLHQGLRTFGEMGGLRRAMPLSALLFGIGALALAAIPPADGFFSKEALLVRVKEADHLAFWLLILGSALTAAYAARAWLGAFGGAARSAKLHAAHEPSGWLQSPVAALAAASLLLALLWLPPLKHAWGAALGTELPKFSLLDAGISLAAILAGLAWVGRRYRSGRPLFAPDETGLARAAHGWFGLIGALDRAAVLTADAGRMLDRLDRWRPADRAAQAGLSAARRLATFDVAALSRASLGLSGGMTIVLARASEAADARVLDGGLRQLARALDRTALGLSRWQNGLLHSYYARAGLGIGLAVAYAFFLGSF